MPHQQRGVRMRAEGSRKGAFEDQFTYVERLPKLWCVTRFRSQHGTHETEDFQCELSSHAQAQVSAQEGTWEWYR